MNTESTTNNHLSIIHNHLGWPSQFCIFLHVIRNTKDFVRKNNLFMQNEPNFKKVKLSVTKEMKKDYEQMDTWSIGKNEPKTNPIEADLPNAQMNVTVFYTKDYENKSNWALFENKPNTNPIKANFRRVPDPGFGCTARCPFGFSLRSCSQPKIVVFYRPYLRRAYEPCMLGKFPQLVKETKNEQEPISLLSSFHYLSINCFSRRVEAGLVG